MTGHLEGNGFYGPFQPKPFYHSMKLKYRRFPLNTMKNFCAAWSAGTDFPERLWGPLLGDLQKLPALGGPTCEEVGAGGPRGSCHPQSCCSFVIYPWRRKNCSSHRLSGGWWGRLTTWGTWVLQGTPLSAGFFPKWWMCSLKEKYKWSQILHFLGILAWSLLRLYWLIVAFCSCSLKLPLLFPALPGPVDLRAVTADIQPVCYGLLTICHLWTAKTSVFFFFF